MDCGHSIPLNHHLAGQNMRIGACLVWHICALEPQGVSRTHMTYQGLGKALFSISGPMWYSRAHVVQQWGPSQCSSGEGRACVVHSGPCGMIGWHGVTSRPSNMQPAQCVSGWPVPQSHLEAGQL